MSIFKWVAGAVAGLVVLIIIAVLLVPMFVDPNDYREDITSLVKDNTGRDLELAGDLQISVFPWLGIKTEGLSMSQPDQIGGDMVSVKNAQLRLKLLPLLGQRLEIDTIVLDQPILNLITLEDGTSSFSGLAGEEATETEMSRAAANSAEAASAEEQDADASAAVALVVQGVEITNANVVWDDRQANQKYSVNDFNLTTGNLLGGSLAPLEMTGSLVDSADPTPIDLAVKGQVMIDPDTLVITIKGLETDLSQGEQGMQLGIADMLVDQNSAININGLAVGTQLEGRPFNLDIPAIAADMEKQTANIASIQVTSKDMNLTLSDLVVRDFVDNPSAMGKLNLVPFNAAALLKDLAIDYVPSKAGAMEAVGLALGFQGGMESAQINDLAVTLDQSNLTGSVVINDFESLAAEFTLALDTLNVDDYLPAGESVAEESEAEAIEGAEALAVPLAAMQGLNINGSLTAQQLVASGLKLNDLDVNVASADGVFTVTPKVNLYDGKLDGVIEFDEASETKTLKVKNSISLVDLGAMMLDADVSDQLSGLGTLDIDVMVTETDGVQGNEGVIKLLAKNGALKGVDIKGMIDSASGAVAKLTGQQQEDQEGQGSANNETRFAELLGTFYLKDYVLRNDDFSMKAPLFRVTGNGVIDVANDTMNYLVNVTVVGSTAGQGGAAVEELAGLTIPVRLRGAMSDPSYSLDMKELTKNIAKRELRLKKDSLLGGKDEKENRKEKAKKLLKGLFDR